MEAKNEKSGKPEAKNEDALFEALGKQKKRKKRKLIITVAAILVAVLVIGWIAVSLLQDQVREQFATENGEVLSYQVVTGSINTTVSGSGSLTDVDLDSVTVPEGVEITEIKVKTNQSVASGDILATVDMASVISAAACRFCTVVGIASGAQVNDTMQ